MDGMDAGALGWMYKKARCELWRVARFYEMDDLVQDGHVWWYYVCRRYGDREPQHRMALFKTCYTNHIHDLAKGVRSGVAGTSPANRNECAVPWLSPGSSENEQDSRDRALGQGDIGDVMRLLAEAPAALHRALSKLLARPDVLNQPYKRGARGRESVNERLCALAGVDPAVHNLHGDLLDLLSASM